MSIATRATSHTRGAGLPHLGQASDTWLQRTCRIVHGTAPTAEQLGSTDEGPRRATTGPWLRQFRTLVLAVRRRPFCVYDFPRNDRPFSPVLHSRRANRTGGAYARSVAWGVPC